MKRILVIVALIVLLATISFAWQNSVSTSHYQHVVNLNMTPATSTAYLSLCSHSSIDLDVQCGQGIEHSWSSEASFLRSDNQTGSRLSKYCGGNKYSGAFTVSTSNEYILSAKVIPWDDPWLPWGVDPVTASVGSAQVSCSGQ